MKKKLFVMALVFVCMLAFSGCCFHSEWYAATCDAPKTCVECGETEGEALGHSWTDADCENPKTCANCSKTEGKALGHNWEDATTEAPKTCTNCAATEGERIITDERFTTAATAAVQGNWSCVLPVDGEMMGIADFDGVLNVTIRMDLHNDGTMKMGYAVTNAEEFNQTLRDYLMGTLTAEFEAQGLDQEAGDELMVAYYGMTSDEFVDLMMAEMDFASLFEASSFDGVYYVEGNQLYNGLSWDELEPAEFSLEGDTLILREEISGISEGSLTFTREAE